MWSIDSKLYSFLNWISWVYIYLFLFIFAAFEANKSSSTSIEETGRRPSLDYLSGTANDSKSTTTATTPLIGSSNLTKLTQQQQQQQQQLHHQTQQQQQQKISIEDFLTTQQTSSFAVKTEPTTTTATTTTSRPANIVANRSSLGENCVVDKQAERNRGKEDIKRGISFFFNWIKFYLRLIFFHNVKCRKFC
jgi:hypothetical protein